MPKYDDLNLRLQSGNIGGGIKKSSQRERKQTSIRTYGTFGPSLDASGGICAALVVRWIKAKVQNTNFWTWEANKSSSLLPEDFKEFTAIYEEHRELGSAKRMVGKNAAYATALEGVVSFVRTDTENESVAKYSETKAIANTVLTDKGRCFILSISRDGGAHALGLYRDYSLFGTKDWVYFYDPNVGEFWAKKLGIEAILGCYGKYDTSYSLRVFE